MDVAEDIVFQILLRLPVLSLLLFRCVCKRWCAVIDSPIFKDAYLAVRRALPVDDEIFMIKVRYDEYFIDKIFVTGFYSDYESFLLESALAPRPPSTSNHFEIRAWTPTPPRHPWWPCKGLKIISHVNGLICVQGENWFDITLINPALREYRILPVPNLGEFKYKESQDMGFGYDDVNDEYKVVAIVTVFKQDLYEIPYTHLGIVYRLSSDSWTILDDMSSFLSERYATEDLFMGLPSEQRQESSIFSHGAIHWCIGTFPYDPVLEILAFNTSTELIHVIQFPHGWTTYRTYLDSTDNAILPFLFNVDKSTIALVGYTNTDVERPLIEVWVMKEYGDSESWTKLHSITSFRIIKTLSFWRKDKLLLISIEGFFICYDLRKGQLCEQEHWVTKGDASGWEIQLVTGHESFVSVKPVSNQED